MEYVATILAMHCINYPSWVDFVRCMVMVGATQTGGPIQEDLLLGEAGPISSTYVGCSSKRRAKGTVKEDHVVY